MERYQKECVWGVLRYGVDPKRFDTLALTLLTLIGSDKDVYPEEDSFPELYVIVVEDRISPKPDVDMYLFAKKPEIRDDSSPSGLAFLASSTPDVKTAEEILGRLLRDAKFRRPEVVVGPEVAVSLEHITRIYKLK